MRKAITKIFLASLLVSAGSTNAGMFRNLFKKSQQSAPAPVAVPAKPQPSVPSVPTTSTAKAPAK